MESTIEKLYYGTINDGAESGSLGAAAMEEDALYNRLHSTFTAEQSKLFERYEALCCDRQNEALESTYKKGFQRGASLMLEVLKES